MVKSRYKSKIIFLIILTFAFLLIFTNVSMASYTSIYKEPSVLIKNGSTGEGVKWVQDMLNHCGYNLNVDGKFGALTNNAVINFQKNNGLVADGIVGANTKSALKKCAYSSNSPSTINEYRYTTTSVNFRTGPGTSYKSKEVLYTNAKVYVYQIRADGWAYVKYNNSYGYISAKYLSSNKVSTQNGLPTFKRTNTSILGIIKACKEYYANNNFTYNLAPGARSIPADKSKLYNGTYAVDCSTYVSWVLYEYALINGKIDMQNYFSYQRNSSTFAYIGSIGGNSYLSVVSAKGNKNVDLSKAKAGDILVSNGHVEFFSSYLKNRRYSFN